MYFFWTCVLLLVLIKKKNSLCLIVKRNYWFVCFFVHLFSVLDSKWLPNLPKRLLRIWVPFSIMKIYWMVSISSFVVRRKNSNAINCWLAISKTYRKYIEFYCFVYRNFSLLRFFFFKKKKKKKKQLEMEYAKKLQKYTQKTATSPSINFLTCDLAVVCWGF